MAVDIAVCFCRDDVTPEKILKSIELPKAGIVYIVGSKSLLEKGIGFFFALWSNFEIDLVNTCKELSLSNSKVCISWKVEHSGMSGQIEIEDGEIIKNETVSGKDYLNLPFKSINLFFGVDLSEKNPVTFPEVLFDNSVECFLLRDDDNQIMLVPNSTVDLLFEDELDVELVFPFPT